jgi:Zn-dependent protease
MASTRRPRVRLLGIPVRVDVSWFIILVLLVGTLVALFHREVPTLGPGACWLIGLLTALVFFLCILLHELGHVLVARAVGIPIRGITLFLFGGVAELADEPRSAKDEFLMAAAGPIVSAVLAALFGIGSVLGTDVGWPREYVAVLYYLAWINTTILLFNLAPAFPLDGGRIFRSILWGILGDLRRATRYATRIGQGFAWALVGVGVLSFMEDQVFQGIWLCLIGLFLNRAARGGYEHVLLRQALQGKPVSGLMTPQPVVAPPDLDLRHWVDDYVYRYHHKMFPVASNGHVEGMIATPELTRFPREDWARHTVAEAMRKDVEALSITPDGDASDALAQMQRTGSRRLLVTDHDRLVGVVSLKDLLDFLDVEAPRNKGSW